MSFLLWFRGERKLKRSFRSEISAIERICAETNDSLRLAGADSAAFAVDLLLREAVNNAIVHGNDLDPLKSVRVEVRVGRRWIGISVEDEGPGFDWRAASRAVPVVDAVSGRGLAIGSLYSDVMRFNRRGNRVEFRIDRNGTKETD